MKTTRSSRLFARAQAILPGGVDSVVSAGGCTVAMARFQVLRKTLEDFPPLAEAFERRAVREQAIAREWMVNVGARRASVRLGHMICEIFTRLRAMGLTEYIAWPLYHTLGKRHMVTFATDRAAGFDEAHIASLRKMLPITQIHMAEALGLSSVHVNRELQALRAEGLLKLAASVLVLPDLPRLERLSDFSPVYLNAGRSRRWAYET